MGVVELLEKSNFNDAEKEELLTFINSISHLKYSCSMSGSALQIDFQNTSIRVIQSRTQHHHLAYGCLTGHMYDIEYDWQKVRDFILNKENAEEIEITGDYLKRILEWI